MAELQDSRTWSPTDISTCFMLGQIALELESLTLGADEQGERVHGRKFTRKNSGVITSE